MMARHAVSNARALLDAAMTERDFMAQIVACAKANGWAVFHPYDSRRSNAGWPDLVLVRGATALFIECKTEKGKVAPEQQAWIDRLGQVKYVEAAVARPHNWPDIEAVLKSARR